MLHQSRLLLVLTVAVVIFAGLCCPSFADKGPVGLANLQAVSNLPYIYTGVRAMGCSSHDRTCDVGDAGHFLYQVGSEYYMMDVKGPGCVYRLWVTAVNSTDRIRVYLDGASTPQIDKSVADLFGGSIAPFLTPLVGDANASSGGYYCYLPIPYRTGCKISVNNSAIYYNVGYQQYSDTTGVTTWTGSESSSAVISQWNNCGSDPKGIADASTVAGTTAVTNGSTATIMDQAGPAELSRISISIPRLSTLDGVSGSILWNTYIKIYWDNQSSPAVNAPLGPFFGVYTPGATVGSLLVGTTTSSQFYCYYPMPYGSHAKVQIYNGSGFDISSLTYNIGVISMANAATMLSSQQVGYFTTTWNSASLIHDGRDYNWASPSGQGVFVGLTTDMVGNSSGDRGYLEGNERLYYDGSLTPQINGTGTEDYFNGGFYFSSGTFCKPLHGNPTHLTSPTDATVCYRMLLGDRIQYKNGGIFGMQHGSYDQNIATYNSLFYAYQTSSATLTQTDTIDVGNSSSESAHSYSITSQQWNGSTTQYYEGANCGNYYTWDGRSHNGTSQFTVAVSSTNGGVILRRRMNYANANQNAGVYVNNNFVGYWYDAGNNVSKSWRDSEFNIPYSFTAGLSSMTVKIVYISGDPWTEYDYWIFSINDTSGPPPSPGTLTGNVKNLGGTNLSGATVTLPTGGSATTNSSGNYTISSVTPGTYTATASLSGYASSYANVTITSGNTTTQNFTLSAPGTLSGNVKNAGGTNLSGATVTCSSGGSATTDSSGNYTISSIAPGSYTATASLNGYTSSTTSVTITAGNTTTQNFTLSPSAEHVTNGNFASGSSGWSTWAQRGTISPNYSSSCQPTGYSGNACEVSSGNLEGGIYQQISLVSGASYTFSVNAKDCGCSSTGWWIEFHVGTTQPTNGNDYGSGCASNCSSSGCPSGDILMQKISSTGFNQSYSCTFTAPASTCYVVVKWGNDGSHTVDASIANISVQGQGPCSTPSTPGTPTINGATYTTLALTNNSGDSAPYYCYRANGPFITNQYVQSNGTIGATQYWGWTKGTHTISGLAAGFTYSFDVAGAADSTGSCPTGFSSVGQGTTSNDASAPTISSVTPGASCVSPGGTVSFTASVTDADNLSSTGIWLLYPNLLTNPSFETGDLSGWTNTSTNPYSINGAYPNPGSAKDGSKWAGAGSSSSSGSPELRQVVSVTAGKTYFLYAWAYLQGSPTTCTGSLQWYNGTATADNQGTTVASLVDRYSLGWQCLSGSVTPTGSTLTVILKLGWSGNGGGNWDNAGVSQGVVASSWSSPTASWSGVGVSSSTLFRVFAVDSFLNASITNATSTVNIGPAAPGVPTVSGPTANSLTVANNSGDSSSLYYAIRINGGGYTNQFVQSSGTVGSSAVWQAKSSWGTKTVTGLSTGNTYAFDVAAANDSSGSCPSSYGTAGQGTTVNDTSAPVISAVTPSATCVNPGGTVGVTASVTDPDNLATSGIWLLYPNLLTNPSFETGDFTGWTNTSVSPYSSNDAYPNPVSAEDGSKWVGSSCAYGSGTETPELRQVVSVTAGKPYLLYVWVYLQSSPNTCTASLQYYNGTATADGQGTTLATITSPSSLGWQCLYGTVTPTTSTLTYILQLNWSCSGSGGGGNWDNAGVSQAVPVGSWTSPNASWSGVTVNSNTLFRVFACDTYRNAAIAGASAMIYTAAPSFATQPVPATICSGNTNTFTVAATNAVSYQWRLNGSNISGATAATYAASAAGNYDCVATNPCGSTTSNTIPLTVNSVPTISIQPISQSVCSSNTATLSVTASGGSLSYQWKLSGATIPGATSSTYTTGAAGNYTCYISNSCGNVTSNAATLTVNTPATITTQPVAATISSGKTNTFTVVASGTATLNYQWQLNDANISGATSSTYTTGTAGNYHCVVSNSCGSVTSNTVALTVNSSTVAASVAATKALADGTVVTLSPGPVVTRSFGTFYYVEDIDRTAGICVVPTASVLAQGSIATILGTIQTVAGERVISGATISNLSSATVPSKLGMVCNTAVRPLAQGLLVRLWGVATVPQGATDTFTLRDGSDFVITVKLYAVALPANGAFVNVQGVLGADGNIPTLRVNNPADLW